MPISAFRTFAQRGYCRGVPLGGRTDEMVMALATIEGEDSCYHVLEASIFQFAPEN